MEIAKVHISGTRARTVCCKEIPRGIVGAKVALEYDEELWSGLTKKVVFTNGIRTVELVNPGGLATLPPEVVDTVGRGVRIGVCGTDADGKLVVPTLWAALSVVRNAVPVESDAASAGTLPVWAQAMAMIGNLDDLDTDARKNLVAAVNELASRGGKIDAAEVQRIVDEYLAANMPEADLPEALPNPHPLRLTGAVEATYDGSEAVEVEIPQGGAEKEWRLLADVEITEEVKTVEIPTLPNGESYEIGELSIWGAAICLGTTERGINIRNNGTILCQVTNAVAKAGTSLTERRFYCEVAVRNGLARGIYSVFNSSAQQSSGIASGTRVTAKEYEDRITSISVGIATTADSFGVGTWFKIWGR